MSEADRWRPVDGCDCETCDAARPRPPRPSALARLATIVYASGLELELHIPPRSLNTPLQRALAPLVRADVERARDAARLTSADVAQATLSLRRPGT